MKIHLDNFVLEEYSKDNYEHIEVINKLNSDDSVKRYLGNINYSIARIERRKTEDCLSKNINSAFISYYNDYPIGYISIYYKEGKHHISYGILCE